MRTIHHPIHYQNRITGHWFIFIHTPHESANGTLKCHSEGSFLHTFVLFWFTINFLNCFFHSDACEPNLWFRSRFRFHFFFLAPNHCTNRFLLFISLFDCYRFLPAVTIFRLKLNSYRPHFAGMIIMQIEQIPKKKLSLRRFFANSSYYHYYYYILFFDYRPINLAFMQIAAWITFVERQKKAKRN